MHMLDRPTCVNYSIEFDIFRGPFETANSLCEISLALPNISFQLVWESRMRERTREKKAIEGN